MLTKRRSQCNVLEIMDWEPPGFLSCKQTEEEGDTVFICSAIAVSIFWFLVLGPFGLSLSLIGWVPDFVSFKFWFSFTVTCSVHLILGRSFFEIGFLLALSSLTGNGSTTSGFYRAIDGHLCTHENCALWTSRKSGNYGRRFLGCSQFNVRNNSIGVFHLNWIELNY